MNREAWTARVGALGLAVSVILSVACEGPTAPRGLQAGSTLMVTIDRNPTPDQDPKVIGYGGTQVGEDYQRGTMFFRLAEATEPYNDLPGPVEMEARLTSNAVPSLRAKNSALLVDKEQIVSVIDIPTTVDPGDYVLKIIRRTVVNGQPVDDSWPEHHHFPITIVAGAGTTTDFEAWFPDPGVEVSIVPHIGDIVPRPAVNVALGCTPSCSLYGIEIDVTYAPGVIQILDVVPEALSRATIWFDDDGAGSLRIVALDPMRVLPDLQIVFKLVDGANAVLDLTDPLQFSLSVDKAWNKDGVSLMGTSTVTADVTGVL